MRVMVTKMKNLSKMNKVKYKVILDNQVDPRILPNYTTINLAGIADFRRIYHIDETLRERFSLYNTVINHSGRTIKLSYRNEDLEWKKVIDGL